MANKATIGAVLKLDDKSTDVLERVKKGFGEVGDKADGVQGKVVNFLRDAAATAFGFQLSMGASSLAEFGKAALQKSLELSETKKQMAGLLGMVDKSGASFEELTRRAEGFNTKINDIASSSGVAKNTLVDLFQDMAEKFNPQRAMITASGKSVLLPQTRQEKELQRTESQIEELMQKIGKAGAAVRGGPEALAQSMMNFSAAGAKASDPIVQMIAQTGVLKGSAKAVAEQLHMLTDASALSFAEEGIHRMAIKMAAAPPNFQTVVNQLASLKDQIVTQFADPVIKVIGPTLDRFRKMIQDNKAVLEMYAKWFGDEFGKVLLSAASKMEEGFRYAKTHSAEIKQAIVDAANTLKSVIDFVIEHKELLAAAFGAKAVLPSAGSMMSLGGAGLDLAGKAGASHVAQGGVGAAAGATAAGGVAIASAAAAVVAWGLAVNEANKYLKTTHGFISPWKAQLNDDLQARIKYFQEFSSTNKRLSEKEWKEIMELRNKAVAGATELDDAAKGAQVGKMIDDLISVHNSAVQMQKPLTDVVDRFNDINQSAGGTGQKLMDNLSSEEFNALFDTMGDLAAQYNNAAKTQNTAVMQSIASTFAGSKALSDAFLMSSHQLEGGFDGLAELLTDKSSDLYKRLMEMAQDKKAHTVKPTVQFTGAITIKQDFRDQDPDRIAIIFQRDLIRAAESRRQSSMGTAFGL